MDRQGPDQAGNPTATRVSGLFCARACATAGGTTWGIWGIHRIDTPYRPWLPKRHCRRAMHPLACHSTGAQTRKATKGGSPFLPAIPSTRCGWLRRAVRLTTSETTHVPNSTDLDREGCCRSCNSQEAQAQKQTSNLPARLQHGAVLVIAPVPYWQAEISPASPDLCKLLINRRRRTS